MAGIFLAAPPIDPEELQGLWTHMSHTWTGWDDTEWELCSPESAVWLMANPRGLTMPPVQQYSSESPAVAGARWRGHRVSAREAFWVVKIWTDTGSQAWIDYDRAFWRTMQPAKTGLWTVTQPNGMSRSLRLRFVDDGAATFETDPALIGWTKYGITFTAEDPYWFGAPVTREWFNVSPPAFFPGPPWNIASSHTLGTATLTNTGDVESYPVWTINGPFTYAEVGVAGQVVEVPFSLTGGQSLVIDTDPRAQTAVTDAGVDRTGDLGAVGFTPVPAGQLVPLSLSLTGAGSVSVSLSPRYLRAW